MRNEFPKHQNKITVRSIYFFYIHQNEESSSISGIPLSFSKYQFKGFMDRDSKNRQFFFSNNFLGFDLSTNTIFEEMEMFRKIIGGFMHSKPFAHKYSQIFIKISLIRNREFNHFLTNYQFYAMIFNHLESKDWSSGGRYVVQSVKLDGSNLTKAGNPHLIGENQVNLGLKSDLRIDFRRSLVDSPSLS